jgi:hypothetical protein
MWRCPCDPPWASFKLARDLYNSYSIPSTGNMLDGPESCSYESLAHAGKIGEAEVVHRGVRVAQFVYSHIEKQRPEWYKKWDHLKCVCTSQYLVYALGHNKVRITSSTPLQELEILEKTLIINVPI